MAQVSWPHELVHASMRFAMVPMSPDARIMAEVIGLQVAPSRATCNPILFLIMGGALPTHATPSYTLVHPDHDPLWQTSNAARNPRTSPTSNASDPTIPPNPGSGEGLRHPTGRRAGAGPRTATTTDNQPLHTTPRI